MWSFQAKVLEIIPSAVYNEEVIDQNVKVELNNRTVLEFFDPDKLVTKKMVNKKINVSMKISLDYQSAPKILKKAEKTINGYRKVEGEILDFQVYLDSKKQKRIRCFIDCGAAVFEFDSKYLPKMNKGDFISIEKISSFILSNCELL